MKKSNRIGSPDKYEHPPLDVGDAVLEYIEGNKQVHQVVKVTATQAILDNGERLKRTAFRHLPDPCFKGIKKQKYCYLVNENHKL